MQKNSKKGYTILELLIVVTIIGIIAIPCYWFAQGAYQNSCKTLVGDFVVTLNKQLDLYEIHSLELGRDIGIRWQNKEEAVQALIETIEGTEITLLKDSLKENKLLEFVEWDNRPPPLGKRFVMK